MKLNKQWAGVILGTGCVLVAGSAQALQFEKATVESSLNAPLKARFSIGHLTPTQRKTLKVHKAPKSDYHRFNFKRKLVVGQIQLKTKLGGGNGPVVVHLSTDQPIHSSVVSFLAEATTKNGKYFHRYDLLINPKQHSASKSRSSSSPGANKSAQSHPSEQHSGGTSQSGQIKVSRDKQYPGPGKPRRHQDYGPVKKGQTLWSIANKLKPSGTTTPQMAVALYRATPKAFNGGINGLETGAHLTVPYAKNVRAINKTKAKRELEGGS